MNNIDGYYITKKAAASVDSSLFYLCKVYAYEVDGMILEIWIATALRQFDGKETFTREERLLHNMLLEAEANDAQVLRVLKWSGS